MKKQHHKTKKHKPGKLNKIVLDNIESRLFKTNISYTQLASMIGISINSIYRKKRNEASFTVDELERISKALGTTPRGLLDPKTAKEWSDRKERELESEAKRKEKEEKEEKEGN